MAITITTAQMRKIHVLAKERGIDNDVLHAHVFLICKKASLKELTIMEAVGVIDSLEGKKHTTTGMMTDKQKKFMNALVAELQWTNERLDAFIKERFKIDNMQWVTSKIASQVIEALKAMSTRKQTKEAQG